MNDKLESILYLERKIGKLNYTIENLIEDNIKLKEKLKKCQDERWGIEI
jgi:hypothetical protein|tara:strand:+ start:1866 stop:2012 length:147 start_codon:yes stop_codon:yes gene_type:complete